MRTVICGYYGEGNAGDEALLVAVLQMLPPGATPVVLSGNPEQTRDRYGVESHYRRSLPILWKTLKSADAFIWGGGSLMQDATSLANPFYYGGLMFLAQRLGLKTIAWAQGIGPLRRPIIRWLTRQILRGCTVISVRDQASAKLLEGWQIQSRLAPDPVWALDAFEDSVIQTDTISELPTPRVAVNLRTHSQLTPERLETLTQALVQFQQTCQVSLLLLPFQASQDLAIARSIATHLTGSHRILLLQDPRELKGMFRQVNMTIGMRLHSLIMAAAEGCPCFALSYDPKVSQLMDAISLPGWELIQLPKQTETISQAWIDAYEANVPLSTDQRTSLRAQALRHAELLHHTLSVDMT